MISFLLVVEGLQVFRMSKPEMPKPGGKTLGRICCFVIPIMKTEKELLSSDDW